MRRYNKPPLDINTQILRLKSRGLRIVDEQFAARTLANISFYRLRAYTYPFQDNDDPGHPFLQALSFEQIIEVYDFDRDLRLLIFDAIEKIEISLRTKIIYHFALVYGSHWQGDQSRFHNIRNFERDKIKLEDEVARSTEPFIKHYKDSYHYPASPPSWMALEVVSMGLLSKLFANLKNSPEKKEIAKEYGLPNANILESWMHAISALRNICAHHGRVWNRRLTLTPKLPNDSRYPFLRNRSFSVHKIYGTLSCMCYLLAQIDPNHRFKQDLKALIQAQGIVTLKEMGFPLDWESEQIWT